MASRSKKVSSKQSAQGDAQGFVVAQLEEARRRIEHFEKELVKRGRAQQRELEAIIRSVRDGTQLKALEAQASVAGAEVKKRLDGLQSSVLTVLGVASRDDLRLIQRELTKLTKRVNGLATRRPTP